MNILITGASGFVGSQIVTDLLKANHHVTCCVRNVAYTKKLFPRANVVYCDFQNNLDEKDWLPHLKNIDVVINTVGIFYHPFKKIIWQIHYEAPIALFNAAVKSGVKKIIHISALGIEKFNVDYATSKKAADDYLLSLPISAFILRPSLIYGQGSYGGTSLFRGLVGLPGFIPVPGKGSQQFQPIYLPDLSKAILKLLDVEQDKPTILTAVSEQKISLESILKTLREWLGFSKAIIIKIPLFFIRMASWFGNLIPYSTLNQTGFTMMSQDNITSEYETKRFRDIVGFSPRNYTEGIFAEPSHVQDRWHAKLFFVKPLLQAALAFLWIFTGLCSLFFYSTEISYQLLSQVGVPTDWQAYFLYGASTIDILIGLTLLFNFQVRKICVLQILMVLIYTLIITIKLPHFWLEPFGPISKNIPLLVSIYILFILESDR